MAVLSIHIYASVLSSSRRNSVLWVKTDCLAQLSILDHDQEMFEKMDIMMSFNYFWSCRIPDRRKDIRELLNGWILLSSAKYHALWPIFQTVHVYYFLVREGSVNCDGTIWPQYTVLAEGNRGAFESTSCWFRTSRFWGASYCSRITVVASNTPHYRC